MEISSTLTPNSIVNILTLRYDLSIPPQLPQKTWKDFESSNIPPNIEFIENLISNDISEKLNSLKTKKSVLL